jgi:hypothetical protein
MAGRKARWITIGCALLAAIAVAFACQLVAWWSYSSAQVYLMRSRRCFGGECQTTDHAWLGASEWWHRLSAATFGVGLLAGLLAVFIAGALAAGRSPRTAAGSLLVAATTALPCALATMLTFPRLGPQQWSVGALLYVAGLGLATIVALRVRAAR